MAEVAAKARKIGKLEGQTGEPAGDLELRASIWQFPDRLRAPGPTEMLIVRNAHDLLLKVSLPAQSPPTELAFEIATHEQADSEEVYAAPESHSHEFPGRYLANAWGYVIAAAYERYQRAIFAAYGKTPHLPTWPPELQMFFHVRNACSHDGTFDIFESKKRIDCERPPRWRDIVISSEAAVSGVYAIGGLLSLCDAVLLVYDLSLSLDKLRT